MQRDDCRFTLTRDTDTFEVTPEGFFDGNYKYSQAEGQLFFRREFNGDLIFKKTDYTYLKSRYDAGYYCDIYEILIEKKVSGVYQTDWTGYFSMTDGKFDFERCKFTVTPTVQDKYSCILRNWETEVNIIGNNPTEISSKIKSALEIEISYDFGQSAPYHGYLQEMCYIDRYEVTQDSGSDTIYIIVSCRLAILLAEGVNPGGNWVLWDEEDQMPITATFPHPLIINKLSPGSDMKKWVLNGTYVSWKPINTDFSIYENDYQYVYEPPWGSWDITLYNLEGKLKIPHVYPSLHYHTYNVYILKTSTLYSGEDWPISASYNGWPLLGSILTVLKVSCNDFSASAIIAEMFTNATNPATGEVNRLLETYLIQKSDAKRPGASNPATIGKITFKELMEALFNIFQIWWDIDDGNNLILKHQSEIENIPGIDITVLPYSLTTAHKKAIEFDKGLLYRYEKWEFMEANGGDFVGLPIEYDELCTIKDSANKTKTYNIPTITTDLGYVQQNNGVSDDGFCLVTVIDGEVAIGNGLISGKPQINVDMSLASLHDLYWRHNRILSTGLMNGVAETFLSTQKIRKLAEQEITYCSEFDPLEQITTELGDAKVNEAEFFPSNNRLVLNMSI